MVGPPEQAGPRGPGRRRLRAALDRNSVKDAAALVARGETGLPRKLVYAKALELSGDKPD